MNSGTRGLKDRSTSGSISSTNHLSPLLRTRGCEGLFGTLWRSLTSFTSASCNRTRISANSKLLRHLNEFEVLPQALNHSVDPVHVKISCHPANAATVQAQSTRRPAAITLTFTNHNQAVRQHLLRYHVRVRSAFLVRCGGIGPSTAFLANQAPVYCGCPAGTHGCDLVSRVRLDQSANPVVVWLSLVSRVVRSLWRRGAFVHWCFYSHIKKQLLIFFFVFSLSLSVFFFFFVFWLFVFLF